MRYIRRVDFWTKNEGWDTNKVKKVMIEYNIAEGDIISITHGGKHTVYIYYWSKI